MKREMAAAYSAVIIVVILTFIISLNFGGLFTLDEMGFYLTVTGLIYGLIAAFTVTNSWETFTLIRSSIGKEIASLTNMYEMSKHFKDKTLPKKLGKIIADYCNYIVYDAFWKVYDFRQLNHPKFLALYSFIGKIKPKSKKEEIFFDDILEGVQIVSTARVQQFTLASKGVGRLRWTLLLFLSGALVSGMLLTVSPSGPVVSAFVNTIMTAAILLILIVIYELSILGFGVDAISNEPYKRLAKFVKK